MGSLLKKPSTRGYGLFLSVCAFIAAMRAHSRGAICSHVVRDIETSSPWNDRSLKDGCSCESFYNLNKRNDLCEDEAGMNVNQRKGFFCLLITALFSGRARSGMPGKFIIPLLAVLLLLPTTLSAQSKLNIHGYLTQAYAISDGNKIFGISPHGTADYRNLALQFRYDANLSNTIVFQFSHERLGSCPIMLLKEDVELDWGFFEHRFRNAISLKVGKIQIPLGIYNEIRDVGVLLPFYRLPYSPYGEGNYMNETINGVAISHTRSLFSDWSLEMNLYGGGWSWSEWYTYYNPFDGSLIVEVGESDVENGAGSQLWLNFPVEGLRMGLNGQFGHASGGILFKPDGWLGERNFNSLTFSVDGSFSRFYVRSEYARCGFSGTTFAVHLAYFQTGIIMRDHLEFNFQAEVARGEDVPSEALTSLKNYDKIDREINRDYALGVNYSFSGGSLLRVEAHFNHGFLVENKEFSLLCRDPSYTRYLIFSFATSF